MREFSLKTYIALLENIKRQGFSFQTFAGFIQHSERKVIVLRHDVDKLPGNSLNMARLESSLGVSGSYYFRTVSSSYSEEIIRKVAELGHEVGYHYEDVSLAAKRQKTKVKRQKWGSKLIVDMQDRKTARPQDNTNIEEELALIAIESFQENLAKLREIVPIKTICMHGSPLSKWDSRLLWKYYDYRDFGIIGEPYFDIDFNKMLYLTDTGRRWDGGIVNVRDKGLGIRSEAQSSERRAQGDNNYNNWKVKPVPGSLMKMSSKSIDFQNKYKFGSTSEIILAAERGELPDKIMMTFHPQRWTDKSLPWAKELVWQNVKNVGKYFLVKLRDKGLGTSR